MQKIDENKAQDEPNTNENSTSADVELATKELMTQFKMRLDSAKLSIDNGNNIQQARIKFLTMSLNNIHAEKERLSNQLRRIENEIEMQNEKHNQLVESLQHQAREKETSLQNKIQSSLQQLQDLRDFKDKRQQLEQAISNTNNQISKERKDRTNELNLIHNKLIAQREYYEQVLENFPNEVDEYSTKFEELNLQQATNKVLKDIELKREQFKTENSQISEIIKRNDQLRQQIQELEKQKHILQESEKNLTNQSVDLQNKLKEMKKKYEASNELYEQKIKEIKEKTNKRISELKNVLENSKKENFELKNTLKQLKEDVKTAEAQSIERNKKEMNLISVLNESALFILTSLEFQEKDPTKEELENHSSALNAVIRKIGHVSQEISGMKNRNETETKGKTIQNKSNVKNNGKKDIQAWTNYTNASLKKKVPRNK